MKLTSWNCCRGTPEVQVERLQPLQPDIIILQETAAPKGPRPNCAWFGEKPKQGVAVVTSGDYLVSAGVRKPEAPRSAYPFVLKGPKSFNILAVWSHPEPTYVRGILGALDAYRDFLAEAPAIVVGDFNSNAIWDDTNRAASHSSLVDRLETEFGLVSAYHAFRGESQGEEARPTLYFRWHEHEPFHIDYCFVPRAWASRIQDVSVGNYADWAKYSDHRPLSVALA